MKRVLFFSFVMMLFFITRVYAQESVSPTTVKANDASSNLAQDQINDYPLPYPGLLPDSPLYTLKTLRDKIVSWLIADPKKKSEFDLLQADKRLAASTLLLQKTDKYDLAVQTISKGENYLEEAINKMEEAKKQGIDVGSLKDKLKKATKKHAQIISDLQKKAGNTDKAGFTSLTQHVQKLLKETNAWQ